MNGDALPLLLLALLGVYLMTGSSRGPTAPAARRTKPWRISQAGLDHIKRFEGWRDTVYLDQAGKPTVGWGHLVRPLDNLRVGDKITPARGEAFLRADLTHHETNVNSCITVPLAQHEYDALVSFDFNTGGLCGSTLARRLNAGDYAAVRPELARWNKITDPATGAKVASRGLTNRRLAEADVFDRGYA